MKKCIIILGIMLLLTGCNDGKNADWEGAEHSASESSIQDGVGASDFPGTYTVPDGWIKSEEHSMDEMTFYIEKGHEEDELPDNIAVSVGTNPYSLEEHVSFEKAIMQQLLMQTDGLDVQLSGDGAYTAQDDILYTFTIEDADGVVTKQYYILKDYGFCLVQLTNFSGSEGAFEAAQSIVDSFVWDEENQPTE